MKENSFQSWARDFSNSSGFVIFFLALTLIITLAAGEKVATVFLVLVLLNMVIVNVDIVSSIMGRYSRV